MQEFIIENYQWVFSGIGVFLISIIFTVFLRSKSNSTSGKNSPIIKGDNNKITISDN